MRLKLLNTIDVLQLIIDFLGLQWLLIFLLLLSLNRVASEISENLSHTRQIVGPRIHISSLTQAFVYELILGFRKAVLQKPVLARVLISTQHLNIVIHVLSSVVKRPELKPFL